jgi:hypothetical protein
MRLGHLIILSLITCSCFDKQSEPEDSDIFLPSRQLAELTDKKLEEVSGLAASFVNPGYLWTHNDSGNPATVYLVNEQLEIRLACTLQGVDNRDWEDIAVGPGPEANKTYIYVADIGDNNANHSEKYIYRFEEPVLNEQTAEVTITEFEKIVFTLEGPKKDTETILVHPKTKDVYVVSKREKPVYVYRLSAPLATNDTLVAAQVMSLPLTQIVSGGFSPDGQEIIMKNYENIYYWNIRGASVADGLSSKPKALPYTEEPQGEAMTFNIDGSGFYTLSEKIKGEKTFLYFYQRRNN